MYSNLLDNVYDKSNKRLRCNILKSEIYDINCFIKSDKVDSYLPRISFDHKWYLVYQKGKLILKENSKALFCFSDEILHISDIFIEPSFQNKKIMKAVIKACIKIILKDFPKMKYLTLKSLSSSILKWHKLGIEFYRTKDKMRIEELFEEYLLDIKSINENNIDGLLDLRKVPIKYLLDDRKNFDEYLKENRIDIIPMYRRIR